MKLEYLAFVRLPTEKAHGLQIVKTCEALAREGVQVELLVPGRRTHIAEDVFSYYGVEKNFTLTTLKTPDLVPFGFFGFLLSVLWFSEKAKWSSQFWNADVVYSRDALLLFQYLLLPRTFVFEAHQKPTWMSGMVARRAKRLVVISKALAAAYEAAGVLKENIVVAPDAVDTRLFDALPDKLSLRAALNLPRDTKIALYAGHLYAGKGADILAQASLELPDMSFVFVGGTEKDLARFRSEWGSRENVLITGHVPPSEVPKYLKAADVVVLPQTAKDADNARFSSPMKLFEYAASGTPIIASDIPAVREVLDEKSAFFFIPDDVQSLVARLRQAFADSITARNTAGTAAQKSARRFTWEERGRKIRDTLP